VSRTWLAESVTRSSSNRPACICFEPFSIAITVAFVSSRTPSTMIAMSDAEPFERSARRRTSSATTREAAALLAGTGCFDGGIEREQVRLVGDVVDQAEQAADVVDTAGKREGAFAGQLDVGLGLFEVVAGLGRLRGDFVDGVGDCSGSAGELLGGGRRLCDRRRLLCGRGGELLRRCRQLCRGCVHVDTGGSGVVGERAQLARLELSEHQRDDGGDERSEHHDHDRTVSLLVHRRK